MLRVRDYGDSGSLIIVLHGGPGASGHMAPVAREFADSYTVLEPLQRSSGGERLTVARHVADLHDLITSYAEESRPALLGASWGAMLALAYAAAHPGASGPLVLVGCGTFDPVARADLQRTIAERMTEELGERLKAAEQLGAAAAFKASAEAMIPIYSYHVVRSPHEHDEVDAQAHRETWDDMLRLQAEGIYPAAFSTINVPVLMIYGVFDPHPGRLVSSGLQRFLPQLEYRELARCGHYPWLERDAARPFFSLIREWLARHLKGP